MLGIGLGLGAASSLPSAKLVIDGVSQAAPGADVVLHYTVAEDVVADVVLYEGSLDAPGPSDFGQLDGGYVSLGEVDLTIGEGVSLGVPSGLGGSYRIGLLVDDAVSVSPAFTLTEWDAQPTGPLHATVIGQSENVIGFVHTGAYYTVGPYPTLLADVDARIAIPASSARSGADTVATLDQAAIDALDVNPGFVALANLWHVGSGGRPLRMTAAVVPGTSLPQMLDEDDTGRDTAADLAIIAAGASAFGDAQRVVYNWWNAEGSVAKTLGAARSPHLIARNEDGTDADLAALGLEYSIIDTTGRGLGMFPDTARLDLMRPGLFQVDAADLIDPPHVNYTTTDAGGPVARQGEITAPAGAERDAFVASIPTANRGASTIPPVPVLFGDYSGGVKATAPSQSLIHPAMQDADGQQLFAQHLAASLLIAEGHLVAPTIASTTVAPDGSYVDLTFDRPNGGTLSTYRLGRAMGAVASPRPHQQEVMGFAIYRSGDTEDTCRPLHGPGASIPAAYRGTALIHDAATGVVRVTPEVAFADGDRVRFGADGEYGSFILHGHPDYDAKMYLDILVERVPALLAAGYDGVPVVPEVEVVVSGSTAGGGVEEPASFFTTGATGPYFVDPANVPASTTRIRHRITFRVPASAEGASGGTLLLAQESQGFDILLRTNGASPEIVVSRIEDGAGTAVTPADTAIWTGAYDTWATLEVDADQGAGKFRFSVDGGATTTRDLGTGNGVFQSNREISYLANSQGGSLVPTGLGVGLIESFFTTGGTESLRKRIEGDAATVNADAWKQGGDAM